MEELTKLSKKIDKIESTAIMLQREALGMKRIRDTLSSGVEQVRLQYPQLCLQDDAAEEAPPSEAVWESEAAKALLSGIVAFKSARKGRYPKSFGEMELSEDALHFGSTIPNCFEKAIALVKASQGRKRTRDE